MLIHRSALDDVDPNWVQQRYREGMGVLSIGLSFLEHQQLTGDFCTLPERGTAAGSRASVQRVGKGITVLTSVWVLAGTGLTQEARQEIYDAELVRCKDAELANDTPWSIYSGYQLYNVISPADFDGLALRLLGAAMADDVITGEEPLSAEIEERYRVEGL